MGKTSIAGLALGLIAFSMPAYAGFEWVAPPDAGSAPSGTYQQQTPSRAATAAPEIVSPVIITGDTMSAAPPPAAYQPAYPSSSYAPTPQPGPMQPAASAAPPASPPPNLATATIAMPPATDVVQGFGSQIPLALALRQILPVGYNFTIDQNVDMDMLVSYSGGRPWQETLRDMLRPLGLAAHQQGMTLTIDKSAPTANANAYPPQVSYAPPPPAPPMDVPVVSNMQGDHPLLASALPHNTEVPSFNVNPADGWSATRGDTLRKVLSDWSRRAGVELQWIAEYDYPMEASAHFNGSFEDAVRGLLAGFESARPQPVAELHTNPSAGQMVLVIETRGNNYAN